MPWTLIDSYTEDEDRRFLQNVCTWLADYKCHRSEDCSIARTSKHFLKYNFMHFYGIKNDEMILPPILNINYSSYTQKRVKQFNNCLIS